MVWHRRVDLNPVRFFVYELVGVLGLFFLNKFFVSLSHQCLKLQVLIVRVNCFSFLFIRLERFLLF